MGSFILFPLVAIALLVIGGKFLTHQRAINLLLTVGIAGLFFMFVSFIFRVTAGDPGNIPDYYKWAFVIVGMSTLIVSFFIKQVISIQAGFAIGGLLVLLMGVMENVMHVYDTAYLLILGAGLIFLVWVGMKKR